MTVKIIGEIYSSNLFKYDAQAKTFSANYLDVPGCLRQLSSADFVSGFGMRSVKTGRVIFFELLCVETKPESKLFTFTCTNKQMPYLQAKITFTLVHTMEENE